MGIRKRVSERRGEDDLERVIKKRYVNRCRCGGREEP